jgi:N-acetylglucosamine-6-sulfatase
VRSRRVGSFRLLSLALVAGLVWPASVHSADDVEPPRPDIVVIMLDDTNPHDGRLWAPEIMPNLHRLVVSRAIDFTDFHTEIPLCCPARVNLLTGQHGFNSGQLSNNGASFDPSVSIATELRDVGYTTIYTGKYLNGYPRFSPAQLDPPGWDRFDVFNTVQGKYFWYMIRDRQGDLTRHRTAPEDYSTDVIANIAVRRLRQASRNEPLFALISVYAPHAPTLPAPRHAGDPRCADLEPWAPPAYDEEDVSDKPAYIQALPLLGDGGYGLTATCESLLAVDDLIGRVGHELERQGRLDDTVLVFLADNGMDWGAHRRAGKASPYSTRIPMFVAWPAGRGTAPREEGTLLTNIDIAPTICELAGCEMGPFPNGQERADGLSFAALLRDEPWPWARDKVYVAIPTGGDRPVFHGLRTSPEHPLGHWTYTEYRSGERELYDVSGGPCHAWDESRDGDPCRLENRLAGEVDADTEALAAALAAELAGLRAEVGADEAVRAP